MSTQSLHYDRDKKYWINKIPMVSNDNKGYEVKWILSTIDVENALRSESVWLTLLVTNEEAESWRW